MAAPAPTPLRRRRTLQSLPHQHESVGAGRRAGAAAL